MDAFDLLGLPRQPWLDPAAVRAAFQSRARALHPDAASGDADAFARLNAAQRELSAPASRLRLLAGDRPIPAAPPDIEFGFRVATFAREVDALLGRHQAATRPLARALLATEIVSAHRTLGELRSTVAGHLLRAETALRALEATDVSALAALAGEFTFLDRWHAQLRERDLQLRIATSGGART